MPTGYTADVLDGKVTDFKTFALRCARNFGALITMRDESMDAPIPEKFNPSDYHEKEIQKAQAEVARVLALTSEECDAAQRKEWREAMDAHHKHVEDCTAAKGRLLAMRSQVADWQPPTPDHQNLKDFMIEQLDETIRFDGEPGSYYLEKAQRLLTTGATWRKVRLEDLADTISRNKKYHEEDVQRTNDRNRWVDALRKSLS